MTLEEAIQILQTNNNNQPLTQQQVIDMNYAFGNTPTMDAQGNVTGSSPSGGSGAPFTSDATSNTTAPGAAPITLTKDGETVQSTDYNDIQTKLSGGWTVPGSEIEQFQGGWLIDGLPVNTVITGTIDPAQVESLKTAGKWNPGGVDWDSGPNAITRGNLEDVGPLIGIPATDPANFAIYDGLAQARQQYGIPAPTYGGGQGEPPPGTPPPPGTLPPPGTPPPPPGTPPPPGGNFDATQYNNPTDLLNALLNRTAGTGQQGSSNYNDILAQLTGAAATNKDVIGANYSLQRQIVDSMLPGMQSQLTNQIDRGNDISGANYSLQRQLYDSMIGRTNPAIDQAMSQAGNDLSANARYVQGNLYPSIQTAVAQGQQTGLSPEAKRIQDNLYPSIQAAVARGEQGLSPQAMAALKTQAMEAVPQNFDKIEQELRTQLLRRGALGSNEMPGSAGDIVREFGGLEAQKEGLRSSLMSNAYLSDEQALQQNRSRAMDALNLGSSYIGLNEQATQGNRGNALQAIGLGNQQAGLLEDAYQANQGTGLNAAQIANQLLGTGGQMFDPSAWLNSSMQGLSQQNTTMGTAANIFDPSAWLTAQGQGFNTAAGAVGGQNQSQMDASQLMAQLGQSRVDLEPESLRNLLLSGLMGIGGSALSGYLTGVGQRPATTTQPGTTTTQPGTTAGGPSLADILGTLGGLGRQPGGTTGGGTTGQNCFMGMCW